MSQYNKTESVVKTKVTDSKQPSFIPDEERQLLSALLFYPPHIQKVLESKIQSREFESVESRRIFEIIMKTCQQGEKLTREVVRNVIRTRYREETLQKMLDVLDFISINPSIVTEEEEVAEFIDLIQSNYLKRNTSEHVSSLLVAVNADNTPLTKQQMLSEMTRKYQETFTISITPNVSEIVIKDNETNGEGETQLSNWLTHIDELNDATEGIGMIRGLSMVIGAPSHGKSNFAMSHAIVQSLMGKRVLYFSLEENPSTTSAMMTSKMTYLIATLNSQDNPLYCNDSLYVSYARYRELKQKNKFTGYPLDLWMHATKFLSNITMSNARDFNEIISLIQMEKMRYGDIVVIIDYIQLVKVRQSTMNRQGFDLVSSIYQELQGFSAQLNVPIIVLHQQNADSQRKGKTGVGLMAQDSTDLVGGISGFASANAVWSIFFPLRSSPDSASELLGNQYISTPHSNYDPQQHNVFLLKLLKHKQLDKNLLLNQVLPLIQGPTHFIFSARSSMKLLPQSMISILTENG